MNDDPLGVILIVIAVLAWAGAELCRFIQYLKRKGKS